MRSLSRKRMQFKPVLTLGFFTITAVFLVFGAVGYAAFGEATQDVITHNLPAGWSKNLVNLALCCALFFTFPVMMVPVYEILEKAADSSEWFQHSVSPLKRCASARSPRTCPRAGRVVACMPGIHGCC